MNYLINNKVQNEDLNYCHYSGLPSPMAYMEEEIRADNKELSIHDIDRVIEMAWEDRTPFDAIKQQFGLNENDVKSLMKKTLKFSSYKRWRKRVENCKTKHYNKRELWLIASDYKNFIVSKFYYL